MTTKLLPDRLDSSARGTLHSLRARQRLEEEEKAHCHPGLAPHATLGSLDSNQIGDLILIVTTVPVEDIVMPRAELWLIT